jgi:polygalacturonase
MPKVRNLPCEMQPIPEPTFPDQVFDVRNYGGVRDGKTDNTQAFRRAIQLCSQAGGGTVLIPAGEWLTGPIHLLSNVNLHLEKDARVLFSQRFADYLPVVFTRWEGIECYNYSPLIYAANCEKIAITGGGILDGQGEAWWHWKILQQAAAKSLYDAEFEGISVEKRILGTEDAALRPQFLQTIHCRQVLVEGVTFLNGPMWTIHPVYSENVTFREVHVSTNGPNTDGLNPDSCRNVLIEDCQFDTGDDCIAINSGMNEDGWRVGRPCENIIIRHCRMEGGHGGVAIGSGMSGGVRNVFVSECDIGGCDQGIRFKSMRGRGGYVENVYFDNIRMTALREEAIILNMYYGSSTAESRSQAAPVFRNIYITNVICESAGVSLSIRGLPEQPAESLFFEGLFLNASRGIHCQDVVDLNLKNVRSLVQEEPVFDCSNVMGLNVSDMTVIKHRMEA